MRGGTAYENQNTLTNAISIHPPRAGRDSMRALTSASRAYFNPPAPCGAGRNTTYNNIPEIVFQSTRPVRGGTPPALFLCLVQQISIHPPRAGRDVNASPLSPFSPYFNPPAPCGAGPALAIGLIRAIPFQSTRPVRGGTSWLRYLVANSSYFNPPAPCGAGPWPAHRQREKTKFQSTRPVRGGTAPVILPLLTL